MSDKKVFVVEKPWGREVIYASNELYIGKIIEINEGARLSLQLHEQKDETILLWSGKIALDVEEAGRLVRREMVPGDRFHITPGTVHRMTAIDDSEIIEVSTPELDDVIRLKDNYGRGRANG